MTDCSECNRLRGEGAAAFAEYTARKDELAMTQKRDKSFALNARPLHKPKVACVNAISVRPTTVLMPIAVTIRKGTHFSGYGIYRDLRCYTLDKQRRPKSLQDLVDAGYLRAIPVDPLTGKTDWVPDFDGPVLGDPVLSPDLKAQGLHGVHSSSNRIAAEGSQYNTW